MRLLFKFIGRLFYINLKMGMKFLLLCLLVAFAVCDREVFTNCIQRGFANCQFCYSDECIACSLGYKLAGEQCVLHDCSSLSNCNKCYVQGSLKCYDCSYGFEVKDGACSKIQCQAGCAQCSKTSCSLCDLEYTLVGSQCVAK